MKHHISAVIGRGYGDEGKGLATDYLCLNYPDTVVVKHNGGGQAGHTVDIDNENRFVFQQLGSGSFRHADTFWADSFYPDLYKLNEEYTDFFKLTGIKPLIYSDPGTCITLITDILLNLSIETVRGDARHGSCGMGINEADLRTKAGYGVTVSEVRDLSSTQLFEKFRLIRNEYYPGRLKEAGLGELPEEYSELFYSDDVLINFAKAVKQNISLVSIVKTSEILQERANIVFESGQGLLLDAMCERNYPHVTASRTGLTNIIRILDNAGLSLDEVIYVSRSYVTRHGAGMLDNEVPKDKIGCNIVDKTNVPNPWQGTLRYGLFNSVEDVTAPITDDIIAFSDRQFTKSLLFTHLNETEGMIKLSGQDISVDEFIKADNILDKVYKSYSPFSKDII